MPSLTRVAASIGITALALGLGLFAGSESKNSNWPSFRGPHASGVSDGQNLPAEWNAETGEGIRWKTRIPGLAHASPVVWGDRVFVTTAVSGAGDDTFKPGLYGAGTASADKSVHQWKVYALDKATGGILWDRIAYEGEPKEKRHVKSTYASSTPVTDGKIVVALFGSQGVHAFTVGGEHLWSRDLGRMDVGAYDDASYEWGTASSPILHDGKVIIQVDTQAEDYLLALDARNGNEVWQTERDDQPSWGTPTVYPGEKRTEIITNGSKFIRGYDPKSGRELWRLGGSSNITAPTPVFSGERIVVVSGRRPEKPIFVLRAGAEGDITLPEGKTSSEHVVWSRTGRGSYMPSPLIYDGLLYVLQNNGILDCYDLETGEEIYRNRIPHQGSGFSGSPVASDGIIYLPSEDGDIFAIKAGREFKVLAQNPLGELLMSTPALSDGLMIVRAHRHVYAIGRE